MFAPQTRRKVCTKRITVVGLLCAAGLSGLGCGSSGSNGGGTGGAGVSVGTGGNSATGGATATGGARATGGATGTGGVSATGGTTGGGGRSATGGTTGGGGRSATGGTTGGGGRSATGGTTAVGGGTGQVGSIGGCQIFPADNPLNQPVTGLQPNAKATTYLAAMHPTTALHADWGDYAAQGDYYGIPFTSGTGATAVPTNITDWPDESDPAP
ncbi:MAG: hypothetical protein ACJ8F1_16510, partial [Polyangia bacterium]